MPDFDRRIMIPFETGSAPEAPDLLPVFSACGGIPALLLHAELSDLLTSDIARELMELMPMLETATVPQVGHVPDLREPSSIAAIRRFLHRCDQQ